MLQEKGKHSYEDAIGLCVLEAVAAVGGSVWSKTVSR